MPFALERGDRRLLIAAGLLLGLMTVAGLLFAPRAQTLAGRYPSSYSTASGGAKAAYLLLVTLGYRVERWERPPRDLPAAPENVLLLLADPIVLPSAEDKQRIRAFLWNGGRILVTGGAGAALLPEADLHPTPHLPWEPTTYTAQLPGPVSRQAPRIVVQPAVRWAVARAPHLAYYADAQGATVIRYRFGRGEAIWWAASGPLTNSGLTQAFNVMLLLNSVGSPEQTLVLWDEYFHGNRPGLAAYLARTPAPWLLLQLLALAAAVLLTHARRSGPVRALTAARSRLSPLEFVDTLGDLYQRKRAAPQALEIAYHRFRFLLLRRLGLSSAATLEQMWSAVRNRLGWQAPEFLKLLQQCESAIREPELGEGKAVRWIGELHDYARRWRLSGRFRGE